MLRTGSLTRASTAPTPLVDSPKPKALAAQWYGIPSPDGTRIGRINGSKNVSAIKSRSESDATAYGSSGESSEPKIDVVLASQSSVRPPPLVTPRHDIRDDPFSLTGFFPSRPGSPEHSVEWAWRSSAEDTVLEETLEETDEKEEIDAEWTLPSVRSLSMNALDEYAREVIAKESKLGILGLARVPSAFFKSIRKNYFGGRTEEDQLVQQEQQEQNAQTQAETTSFESQMLSAATIDEPFDVDTLCESMHSRRVASEREFVVPGDMPSLGLFSPATEVDEGKLGWYAKML